MTRPTVIRFEGEMKVRNRGGSPTKLSWFNCRFHANGLKDRTGQPSEALNFRRRHLSWRIFSNEIEASFLKFSFFKFTAPCNTSNGNQQGNWAKSVCRSSIKKCPLNRKVVSNFTRVYRYFPFFIFQRNP
jgi:hypothetical protein